MLDYKVNSRILDFNKLIPNINALNYKHFMYQRPNGDTSVSAVGKYWPIISATVTDFFRP